MSGRYLVIDAETRRGLSDLLPIAEPPLADDLVLHAQQTLGERLGTRRAARNVDVHRDQLVHALADRVRVLEEAAARSARAHRDHVLRLRHLLVQKPAALGHLVGERSGHDHQIALPRRRARHAAEPIDVGPRPAGLHQLDAAAGEAEEQIKDAALAGEVDDLVDERSPAGDHRAEILLIMLRHYAAFFSWASRSLIDLRTSCFKPLTQLRSPIAQT